MENLTTPSELRVAALQNAPAFNSLYRALPDEISFRGETHVRDAAVSAEEKLWYMSAVAMLAPRDVYELGVGGGLPSAYGLDADPGEVNAAAAKLRKSKQELVALNAKHASQQRLVDLAISQINNQTADPGQVLAGIVTGGIYTAAQTVEFQTALTQRKGILVQIENDIAAKKAEIIADSENLAAAQTALNAANAQIRAEEERARQEKAASDLAAAKARQDEAEQRQAQASADAASKAAADRATRAANEAANAATRPVAASGGSDTDYSDDYGSGDDGSDPYGEFGDAGEFDHYYADTLESGVYGDEEQSRAKLAAMGEDEPLTLADLSPYSYDRYYACDSCPSHGFDGLEDTAFACDDDEECEACQGSGLDLDGYGAEGEGAVAIVAGVLALAPSVINAFSAPRGGANGSATKEVTDAALKATGVQDKIDAAAKAEGDRIRNTVLLVGAGLAVLAVKFLG